MRKKMEAAESPAAKLKELGVSYQHVPVTLESYSEQDMDAGRLNVGINDADAVALHGVEGRQVGRRVRLAGTTSKGVDRHDFRHWFLSSQRAS